MLTVMHVVQTTSFAGVERHVSVLAGAQAAAGHRVTVVGGDQESMKRECGTAVEVLPAGTIVGAAGRVRTRKPDVIHAHMTAAEFASVLAGAQGCLVSTRHFGARRGATLKGKAASILIRHRLDVQIAVSQYVADRVDGETVIVHPGVAKQGRPTSTRKPWILAVQRLEREKRGDIAIEAFARSGLAKQGWNLKIAGAGALLQELRALAQEAGVGSEVHFLGHRSDALDLMHEASVLISPCDVEALGLAALEAMASGTPVVAAAAGGHLETIGSVSSEFLFPPGDVPAAADMLRALAEAPNLRDDYGAHLQDRQREEFTPERQQVATEEVYLRCLG